MPNVPQNLDFPRQPDEHTQLPEWVKAFHKIAQRQWAQMVQAYNAILKISVASDRPSTPMLDDTLWYEADTGQSYIGYEGAWRIFSGWTGRTVSITSSYTMVSPDGVVLADASSGTILVTANNGSTYASRIRAVKRTSSAGFDVYVVPSTGQIDGVASYNLDAANESVVFTSDGSNLYVLARVN